MFISKNAYDRLNTEINELEKDLIREEAKLGEKDQRIEQLEDLLCPNKQHKPVEIGKEIFYYQNNAVKYEISYICSKCKKEYKVEEWS